MTLIDFFNAPPMVGQRRHGIDRPRRPRMAIRHVGPIRLEAEPTVGPREPLEVVCGLEVRLTIDPAVAFELFQRPPTGMRQRPIDQLPRCHREARMLGAEPMAKRGDHLVVGAALPRSLNQLWSKLDVLMSPALIEVVMF